MRRQSTKIEQLEPMDAPPIEKEQQNGHHLDIPSGLPKGCIEKAVSGTTGVYVHPGNAIYRDVKGQAVKVYDLCPSVTRFVSVPSASESTRQVFTVKVYDEEHDCNNYELSNGTAWKKFSKAT